LRELTAEISSLKQKAKEGPGTKEAIARQGDQVVANRRRNEELGGGVQQLEEENGRLHNSSERLKGQLSRAEAWQQSDIARLQAAMAAGGSQVKEDLLNFQGELAKLKEEIKRMKMTTRQFPLSVKKGTLGYAMMTATRPTRCTTSPPVKVPRPLGPREQAKPFPPSVQKGKAEDRWGREVEINAPDRIISHVTKECGGNVHDRHVVEVTSGSFEKGTQSVSYVVKNAADLESGSVFLLAYRSYQQTIWHTRNNWVCEADWLELDRREKDDLLKGRNVAGAFPVSRSA
jgi:hypothetical protein